MTPVEFRILTADDAGAYSAVRLEALERDPTAFGSSVEDHRKLSESEIRLRISKDPANNFVVGAFVDGRLAGTAGFVRETPVKMRHKGRIWGVYLTAELRGQGIGRIDWQGLGRATRPTGRSDGGSEMTLDPRDGLSR